MTPALRPVAGIRLAGGILAARAELDRAYLRELKVENLLQNHLQEAGLWGPTGRPEGIHWGWESPTSQVRGHFLGHWLAAAARFAEQGDDELAGKARRVVGELVRCQEANGGEWVASIPEKYLHWLTSGRRAWAPQYIVSKTLMGLLEAYRRLGDDRALEVVVRAARWFDRWTGAMPEELLGDVLDYETCGMLEVWADLYAITEEQSHLDLLHRYDRKRLFDPLLAGEDVLTNRHANTTIPEVLGAARAHEVTGESRFRDIVEAYWRSAVEARGWFCTGGQTAGEVWTPPQRLSARLGDTTQEHCTVYNMRRLAECLLRWTGNTSYAAYRERNLYNGILAQQHPATGMVTYFLPMRAGGRKRWGSRTEDFWCCFGTLVQAHAEHAEGLVYEDAEGVVVTQACPFDAEVARGGSAVSLKLRDGTPRRDVPAGRVDLSHPEGSARPEASSYHIHVSSDRPARMRLRLRVPDWADGEPRILVDGKRQAVQADANGYAVLDREWQSSIVEVAIPKAPRAEPLPDLPGTVAFLDGPVVLAGLCDEERTLSSPGESPADMLVPDNEREWGRWNGSWRAAGQERGLRFIPLHEVTDEAYTLYFPVRQER